MKWLVAALHSVHLRLHKPLASSQGLGYSVTGKPAVQHPLGVGAGGFRCGVQCPVQPDRTSAEC